MSNRLKIILSISFLTLLTGLAIWGFLDEKDDMHRIDISGASTVGTVIKKSGRYKGASVLVYDFLVDEIKYQGSRRKKKDLKVEVGDKIMVEYEIDDPTNNRIRNDDPNLLDHE